ncbi:TIGR03643 family protein [Salisediminibacterium halotolerans]|uniref:TIGR03643 family protein n=1 Tax=Salisediminibacterium halotolerans TaxID=517425 RepID=UPI000F17468A|nr:TIGR03643 family protein [Salisediminibacterium halotolerans]RLJ71656.1 uncharacterized protein (TIGR03643 family) [Actinophytocola xinjiangensis]RPE86806.1 uncharacterized protein (TIGR03643 family) [Salisediminibacterium halotolerans]TWG32869.1 uncharacterized protein (TIGR03643 family) [Salisediminibacterium halotolerans]GEL06961.1 TIGR03643 family protein [Salisediminibacterium halotolerans]
MQKNQQFSAEEIDRIVEMAWEDRTPFDAIETQFGLKEKDVIKLMRKEMSASSFKMWRKRMNKRATKHSASRRGDAKRFRSPMQKPLTY